MRLIWGQPIISFFKIRKDKLVTSTKGNEKRSCSLHEPLNCLKRALCNFKVSLQNFKDSLYVYVVWNWCKIPMQMTINSTHRFVNKIYQYLLPLSTISFQIFTLINKHSNDQMSMLTISRKAIHVSFISVYVNIRWHGTVFLYNSL